MDGSPLYLEGFNPAHQHRHPTLRRYAKRKRRLYASPVKYYFIDFGLSVMENEEWGSDPKRWFGSDGHEQSASELLHYSTVTPYDAYLLDVFILGKVFERSLLEVGITITITLSLLMHSQRYSNIDILRPIVEGMTREPPEERMALEDAIAMLTTARRSLNIFRLRGRLHPKGESRRRMFMNDMRALLTDIPHILILYFSRYSTSEVDRKKVLVSEFLRNFTCE